MNNFTPNDYWKAIVLFGLNNATYKMGLGHTLLNLAKSGKAKVTWDQLAETFFEQYQNRLIKNPMPQQGNPARLTKMERIVRKLNAGRIDKASAIEQVAREAFDDVVPRFQTIGTDKNIVKNYFYEFNFGRDLTLTDELLGLGEHDLSQLRDELDARWSLLEGAFTIRQGQQQYQLANDIRDIYLTNGHERKGLVDNIPFLQGYQGNLCFYCGQPMTGTIHVDHVLPRQVINHDEIWNLVLSHSDCNLLKSDYLVGEHFIEKLIQRNENIMGSNHPWKYKISTQLGTTRQRRRKALEHHYGNVKSVLGRNYYWGGSDSYNPKHDPFYRRLITVLNN